MTKWRLNYDIVKNLLTSWHTCAIVAHGKICYIVYFIVFHERIGPWPSLSESTKKTLGGEPKGVFFVAKK